MGAQVVWLKRDLRLRDHWPLTEAARRGPVVVLYVYEPELLARPEHDSSHLVFVNESLAEVDAGLREVGGGLTVRIGRLPDVFGRLHDEIGIDGLWSHEETGLHVTFDRDKRVKRWCRQSGVPWTEIPQHGVVRRLRDREGWAKNWTERMSAPIAPPLEAARFADVPTERIRGPEEHGLPASKKTDVQRGGESRAWDLLKSFLRSRGERYPREMSSPVTAVDSCSRLSTSIAYGCISIRQIFQQVRSRLRSRPPGEWRASLEAFESRLRWHCHFTQKLEDEPRIEFENMHRGFDGLREEAFDADRFAAWCEGRTGFPMVDASMRALHATGWINFRMRAMLASFAAYDLWLHWREPSVFLAQHFLDFEPGIHFPQFQMQSGTTGINALRIYNPTKQVLDHDPEGTFVRRFCPELAKVPEEFLAEPWRMPGDVQRKVGCRIGVDYPEPIVDHAKAARIAEAKVERVRRRTESRQTSRDVFRRHGSRRGPRPRR